MTRPLPKDMRTVFIENKKTDRIQKGRTQKIR